MKRSKTVSLTLMGTSLFVLAACGSSQVEGGVYPDLASCRADPKMEATDCDSAFEEARLQHEQSAPRYESVELCEQEFGVGNCEVQDATQTRSTGFFTPLLVGYFVGRALSRGGGNGVRPLYRGRSGGLFTPGGDRVNSRGGTSTVSRSAVSGRPKPASVQTRASVARSGGFGSRARSGGS